MPAIILNLEHQERETKKVETTLLESRFSRNKSYGYRVRLHYYRYSYSTVKSSISFKSWGSIRWRECNCLLLACLFPLILVISQFLVSQRHACLAEIELSLSVLCSFERVRVEEG